MKKLLIIAISLCLGCVLLFTACGSCRGPGGGNGGSSGGHGGSYSSGIGEGSSGDIFD